MWSMIWGCIKRWWRTKNTDHLLDIGRIFIYKIKQKIKPSRE